MFHSHFAGGVAVALALFSVSSPARAAAVYGDTSAVSAAVRAAATDRVDYVGLGDSNQAFGGSGWDHGFQSALLRRSPMYATGLVSAHENGTNVGAGLGYGYSAGVSAGTATGAPPELARYATGTFPHAYLYGALPSGGLQNVPGLQPGGPIDTRGPLTFQFHYGTFPSGTHTLTPAVRLGSGPFTTLASQAINATTGAYGVTRADLAVAADPNRTGPLEGRWTVAGGADAVGMFGLYGRAVQTNRAAGFAYSTLAYYGGQSARAVAVAMRAAPDDALAGYFGALRDAQGPTKRIVLTINEGLNDRNETAPSVGPAQVADGDSAAAFADNTRAIVDRVRAVWAAEGWDERELHWVFMPSHPTGEGAGGADDAELLAYRDAARDLTSAVPQSVAVDLMELTTPAEMVANGWYLAANDRAHLTQAGYEALSARAVDALAVPEPAGVAVAAIALAVGLLARRRAA